MGFVQILNRLKYSKAYLDSASANPEKFAEELEETVVDKAELIVETKADERYLPVSAASIIAKVRRDERIEELKKEYGEIGSGYPSDKRTINFLEKWLEEHENFPKFTRKSWKTAQRIKLES